MPADDEVEMRERAQKYIKFGTVTEKNVEQLRKLNLAIFPVRYKDQFYTDLATSTTQAYTHLAYFNDILVGAICCRIDPQEAPAFKLYIMTIGVLAPYRRLGIGQQLLKQVRSPLGPRRGRSACARPVTGSAPYGRAVCA
jgi:GNAT superfamily N-acetyltransferase